MDAGFVTLYCLSIAGRSPTGDLFVKFPTPLPPGKGAIWKRKNLIKTLSIELVLKIFEIIVIVKE